MPNLFPDVRLHPRPFKKGNLNLWQSILRVSDDSSLCKIYFLYEREMN